MNSQQVPNSLIHKTHVQNTPKNTKKIKIKKYYTYKAIIVDGVDVLLLGDHVTEAAAGGVLERNAGRFGTQNLVDMVAIVELVVEAFGDLDGLRWVTVLDYDQVVWLKERPPHLQEVQVPNGGDHDVQLVLEQRRWRDRGSSHCYTQRERETGCDGWVCIQRN